MRYFAFLGFAIFAMTVQADSLERLDQRKFVLLGESRLSFLFWDVYDARLYVTDDFYQPDKPFALTLRYLRNFTGSDIAERSIKEIRQQGFTDDQVLSLWEAQLSEIFPDVVEGDEIIGISDPSQGARFFHNGELIGEISDKTFSRWFFDIWLSEKTSEPEMRKSLLGASQ